MSIKPLVSTIILTYNQEDYIAQAIESILNQNVDFSYEIVIGEDFSTDSTIEICMDFQKKYPDIIRVITSDRNVGLLQNWYRSIQASRGKYIAGCGGDDFWHNLNKLSKQTKFLEDNPEYGMVHSEIDYFFQNKNKIISNYFTANGLSHNDTAKPIVELILSGNYRITACSVMFRRVLFDKYFDFNEILENDFLMEDTPLWVEIALHSKIHYMSESFATYRILEETITKSKDRKKKLRFWISNSEMCIYYCNKHNLPEQIKTGHILNVRRKKLQLAFYEKDGVAAVDILKRYPGFSIKDYLWYFAAKNRGVGNLFQLLLRITRKF